LEQSFPFGALEKGGLQVLWEDGERVIYRGWRAEGQSDGVATLAVLPAAERPGSATLDRLAHEFELRDELDAAWAARPLALAREGGRTALLLEDPGGEPLERLIGAPMETGGFLRLAISVAAALGKAHQRGLVHKDVKPANILVNCADGRARLTGFGIASRLPRERQAPEPPEVIAGTLAYMAPEQTGRMNRSIDSRSDLYALGVTFYQMLTGRLPFSAAEPMEWVHCHIARKPAPPADVLQAIPAPLSDIVMKLLAKPAEERYQTAAGLERDLKRCLVEWERDGRIDPFPLGERDAPDRLMISEKLYGREREVEALHAAFDRAVGGGPPELVLVSGYAGVGKSSVVHELHKALVPPRGLFASGKFDQLKRDIPYATLVQAFQSLVRSLLSKSDAELARWREAILQALGPNGRLIADLVPELTLVIGEQPPVPELEPQQAQGRFQLVFRRFIGVFAKAEHPLALFLDDLQWLDAATLDLLEDLLTHADVRHLLLIGAYRDNEVDPGHPLMRKLTAIRSSGEARVSEIRLGPLSREHVGRLIADALGCEMTSAAPLSELALAKAAGNPFFVRQFVEALADEGLLAFDHEAQRWSWDVGRIHAKGYADNVVDLMVGKLTRLPDEAQRALQQFACLGNVADVTALAMALGTSEDEVHAALWEAVRLELVQRMPSFYRFIHDRVQEAAYSLIPEAARAAVHLRIGRLLAAHTPSDKREEAIFEIVGQLNRGALLITAQDEREQLAEFNLVAGQRAKSSAAYASALKYLTAGAALAPKDAWERRRDLIFNLELNRAECEFLTGALAEAEQRLAPLSGRAINAVEQAIVACLSIDLYTTLGQTSSAVAAGLDYLRQHLGIEWSPHPSDDEARRQYEWISSRLRDRGIENLIEAPLMADPASLAALDVLTRLGSVVWHIDANLACLAICQAVSLSLERGNGDGSCPHYVWLGCIAGPRFGDYAVAFRYGRLGCELVERRGLKRFEARTYYLFGAHVIPWTRHFRTGRDMLRRALEVAEKSGDVTFAGYCHVSLSSNLSASGDPLIDVQRETEVGLSAAQRARFEFVVDFLNAHLGLARTLRGLTPKFGSFDGAGFDKLEIERGFAGNPNLRLAEISYRIRELQAHFFAGDYAAAIDASSKAQTLPWMAVSQFVETADHRFYGALAHAAAWDSAAADERASHFEALVDHNRQLQIWAESCPENFENRAALVGAEIARIEGRALDAMDLYERGIRSARANGFVHNEALANELAARFYAARGFQTISNAYLRNARYCYVRWGADGKVRQLDELYPQLKDEPPSGPTSTIGAPVEQLDLATVIKVSQAASSEIVFEKMIDTLMRTAIEQAGAERGLLALAHGAELRIAAEAATAGDAVLVHLRDEPVIADALPESMLNYVQRTRESVMLDDAAASSHYAADPYVRLRRVRSVLCLPLLNQAKLVGVLYLENNLTSGVFAPARISVLKLLASQAAISIENARLYRELTEREARIRRLVDANIIGIVAWRLAPHGSEAEDPSFDDVNDAFLRIVGYEREEFLSRRWRRSDLTPPEWRERDAKTVAELRETGVVQPYEKEYFRKDGSRAPVMSGAAAFDETVTRGVSFVLDLTQHKRTETALRDSEEQWKAVFENNPTMYFMVDSSLTILSVNPFGAEQLGYAPEELIGRPVQILIQEDDRKDALRNKAVCLEHLGQTMSWEVRKARKDGGVIRARETARAMLIKGRPVLLIVSEDITEAKRAEEALREMQLKLAHTNRLETMGQLTASIAHEVNQPIAATVTNAQAALHWLRRDPPDLGEAEQALGRIVRDGARAGEVIQRIRNLTKKAPASGDRVDINAAIREVIEFTRSEAIRNGVSVRTELAEGQPPVRGDRVELQQVILNLVLNAVEAMRGGEEPRELVIATGSAESGDILVSVSDSGPGLSPAVQENLFKAFHTTKPNGLGLGLSICRSIVESRGGRMWASANAPRGAVFQFTLPVSREIEARQ
jgi:PAS domain S-box-containing protein